jgi:uncharacterized membrane protein
MRLVALREFEGVEAPMMGRYGYGYGMMDGYYGWLGPLMMLAISALVVVGIVLLVIWITRASGHHGSMAGGTPPPAQTGHDEAVAIAKRRLANGEISAEQYDEIMRALGS